ncbi:hypothetical protein [Dokdonia sp.]|uniref:hypothetical protein n=1 Tax=Dokdonia sp. TaxID=2024995 RepID=UPI003266C807
MKVLLIENHSNKEIGELTLETQPQCGEWIEYNKDTYSIHRIIHTTQGIKVIGIISH